MSRWWPMMTGSVLFVIAAACTTGGASGPARDGAGATPRPEPPIVDEPDSPGSTTPDPATTTASAPPGDADDPLPSFVTVPDPRPGDLRTEADADLLPADYTPMLANPAIVDFAYGPDPEQRLDLWLPSEPDAPVVVFVHPGGWGPGGRELVPAMVLRFVERGYAVASVDYRGAPGEIFPTQVEDVKRAIRRLKEYSLTDGPIDGDRIVVYGASSGGILASLVAATPGRFEPPNLSTIQRSVDSTVVGVVSVVGPTDLVTMFDDPNPWAEGAIGVWLGCAPCLDEQLAAASPINLLQADLPPAYWAFGEVDAVVPAATQGPPMAEAWGAIAGADNSWLEIVDGAGHNLDQTVINQRSIEDFIDRAVGRR
jgi:acetyl esterase/lipase